jgi:Zn-dependent peptidase ImmA (M78 family)
VRSWSDPASPWKKQLRFETQEFEAMMDELRARAGGECFIPGKGVDVDLVLLRGVGIEADYVDLQDGILGRTIFDEYGGVKIEIARNLSDQAERDPTARRRLRTTCAHECGHVACHRCLYVRDTETLSLFSLDAESIRAVPTAIMCRNETVVHRGYSGQWWEFQANQCMSALLMPRKLFTSSARSLLSRRGFESFEVAIRRGVGEGLVREIATEYDVSFEAALYRLEALGFVPKAGQMGLRFCEEAN